MTQTLPSHRGLVGPLLGAMHALGGSGSVDEIDEKVAELENYPDELVSVLHDDATRSQTELAYRLAWARTYLKRAGLIENSVRGVWSLTAAGRETRSIDSGTLPAAAFRNAKGGAAESDEAATPESPPGSEDEPALDASWRGRLHQILTRSLTPDGFERLTQRLLREAGFSQVVVTGRSGDGGIDGRGIARINGLMSFHVLFQCKRYTDSVGAREIRDFRGAMVGRADKGLFITTSTFSPAALKEATRDGAPPIDLVDGQELADKLKALGLGVKVRMIEEVQIDESWYLGL